MFKCKTDTVGVDKSAVETWEPAAVTSCFCDFLKVSGELNSLDIHTFQHHTLTAARIERSADIDITEKDFYINFLLTSSSFFLAVSLLFSYWFESSLLSLSRSLSLCFCEGFLLEPTLIVSFPGSNLMVSLLVAISSTNEAVLDDC